MDTELARTFLVVAETGSFVKAADRLNISQTTVTARIRSLETQLGQALFERGRHGASLTPQGDRFMPSAMSILQVWERARHDVNVSTEHEHVLSVGGELSLWNPLLLNWLVWMRKNCPEIAVRAEVGDSTSLIGKVERGILDIAVVYSPLYHPGLVVEMLEEERLIMVTTDPSGSTAENEHYVYVDWGPEFSSQHDKAFPSLKRSGIFVGMGPMGLSYILSAGGAGYFRERAIRGLLDEGRLFRVPNAPAFPYPSYMVTTESDHPQAAIGRGMVGLRRVIRDGMSPWVMPV
ncbi:LysR family transcriptional regulator [Marinobacter sp. R17]|uniref:LysR family transcriptional regulator n=1 Tax=Marinobacter sp. R17 TaxID=2484250 RepID=UPI000F4B2908|nr:LysR family transcriptional regulator [Marinobacter sp. R17]ROT97950.1 LysR family transcriptional regulator [Marinobacter sp. R17]